MVAQDSVLIYTAKVCPFAQRALIALVEAGVKHERYEIDLKAKPSWYDSKVNAASKVPVLVLNPSDSADKGGGEESNGTVKLPESMVISEYVAERYADAGLHSSDPLQRAKARYAIERFQQLYLPHWMAVLRQRKGDVAPEMLKALEEFQRFFADGSEGPFFFGKQYGIVDLAIAPFFGRLVLLSQERFLPQDAAIDGKDPHAVLLEDPKYARLQQWWKAVQERPSWRDTWEPKIIVDSYEKVYPRHE